VYLKVILIKKEKNREQSEDWSYCKGLVGTCLRILYLGFHIDRIDNIIDPSVTTLPERNE